MYLFRLILTISPMICFLLVHHLDDIINMAFQKTENNKYCVFFCLKLYKVKVLYNKNDNNKV